MGEHDTEHTQCLVVELIFTFGHIVEITRGVVSLRELTQPNVDQSGQILISALHREDALDTGELGQE